MAKVSESKASSRVSTSTRGGNDRAQPTARSSTASFSLHGGKIPTFYADKLNGGWMIIEYLKEKGWKQVEDRGKAQEESRDLKLYWAQLKSKKVNEQMRPGKQMIYQNPNNHVLTNKIGLLSSLRSYARYLTIQPLATSWHLDYKHFFPQTYRLDIRDERNDFLKNYVEGEIWISKPTAANRGIGIYLVKSQDDVQALKQRLETQDKRRGIRQPAGRVVQRYIMYPLLLNRRKFDVRAYVLVLATSTGHMVFYRSGYCRLSMREYTVSDTDLCTHLTNQALQKKDPQYESLKDDTVWSMQQFNDYVNETHATLERVPENWVLTQFNEKCKQIAAHCFAATKGQLDPREGFYDLIGIDYLIDENFNTFLLEMNTNPALSTNCTVLENLVPDVVKEMMDMTLEMQENLENKLAKIPLPMKTQRTFKCIYNGTRYGGVTPWRIQRKNRVSTTTGPLRTSIPASTSTNQQYTQINNQRCSK